MSHRSAKQPAESQAVVFFLPALAALIAFALALYSLDGKSLWFDEMGTLMCAGQENWLDASRCALTVPLTPKPPLHFVLSHFFLQLDRSAFVLRLVAAIFATLAVPVTYATGRRLFNRQVGLLGAFLLAVAPLGLRYAQEARMYSLFALLSMASLYFFWRALHSASWRWWLAFAAVAVLNFYTHLFAALPLGALVLFALWTLVRRKPGSEYQFKPGQLFVVLLLVILLCLPLLQPTLRGLSSSEGLSGSPAQDWDLESLLAAQRLLSGGTLAGAIVYALLCLVGLVVLAARDRDLLVLFLAWIVLPILTVIIVPFGHETRVRYFIFALPIYLLLAAFGLYSLVGWAAAYLRTTSLSQPARRLLVTALMLLSLATLIGTGAPSIMAYYAESKQDWRGAIQRVLAEAEPGDQVYVSRDYQRAGVLLYAEQEPGATALIGPDDVHVLPADLSNFGLPLEAKGGYWFVLPFRSRFMPGGELDKRLQPYRKLSSPVVFTPENVPKDSDLIARISFGQVVAIRAEQGNLPTVSFWASKTSLGPGDCTWLNWHVDRVAQIHLDGEGVVGHDRRQVCPFQSTTYELEVLLLDGSTQTHRADIHLTPP